MALRIFGGKRRRSLTSSPAPSVIPRETAAGVIVTPANALALADAYACVRVLAETAASLPLIPYRRTAAGDRVRLEQGRLLALLDRPAPQTTTGGLVGQMAAHLATWGNAYLGLWRDGDELAQLACLPPERVQIWIDAGQVVYEYTDELGRRIPLSEHDLVHVKSLSTDGFAGLSPVTQAREALGLSAAVNESAARFWQNDARPSGILKLGQATPERLQELTDAWTSRHQGVRKSHRIAVLSGEVDFSPVSFSAEDAQLLESRQWSSAEVARIFRVPPSMIGAPTGDSLTYGNRESDALQFVTFSLRPQILTPIEEALSRCEELCPGELYLEFKIDALLRSDSATRSQVYTAALDPLTGWMTREEVRKLENLPAERSVPPTGTDGQRPVTQLPGRATRPPLEPSVNGGSGA
ncbi:MAG: phage portal protein [Solirubrobacterales bacterium]